MRRLPQFKPSGKLEESDRENIWAQVHERSAKSMRRIDNLPQSLREIVYDFNINALSAAMQHGLKDPAEIREVLEVMQRDGLDAAIVRADHIIENRKLAKPVQERIPEAGRLTRPKLSDVK